MDEKKISVIIASRDVKDDLKKCLDCIQKAYGTEALDVIVSDNNSTDGTQELLRDHYPWVRLLVSADDIKYTSAINRGLRAASGDYILLLDSDAWVNQDTLPDLCDHLMSGPKAGVAVSKMYYPNGAVQMAARRFPTLLSAIFGRESIAARLFPNNRISKRYMMIDETMNSTEPFEVDYSSAACMMIRREVIDQVGVFDENYLMYWSDADWCCTVKEHGWMIHVVPRSSVVHDMRNNPDKKKSYFMIRAFHQGAFRFFRKHYTKSFLHPLSLFAFIGLSGRAAVQLVINGLKTDK